MTITFAPNRKRIQSVVLLGAALGFSLQACIAQESNNSSVVGEQASAFASDAQNKIEETGKAAANQIETLWQRIDERRLKNRTRDELVAWIIMGLLVGGLISSLGKLKTVTALALGLAGAFVGGIAAHVSQFSLGMGPVLMRYEDLLCSLIGGALVLLAARWFTSRRQNQS